LHKGWVDEVVEPGELMTRALEAAAFYGALSPEAFAQTKKQVRQTVGERMALSGAATDRAVTEIWTQPATLARVADYVARTLNKA
jgi:enoyl-CoA hydratase